MTDPTPTNSSFRKVAQRLHLTHANASEPSVYNNAASSTSVNAPKRRSTLDMEEGGGASGSSLGHGSHPRHSRTVIVEEPGETTTEEQSNSPVSQDNTSNPTTTGSSTCISGEKHGEGLTQRTMEKDGSALGLGGSGAPPRRMTARSQTGTQRTKSFHELFTPAKPLKPAPSHIQSLKNIFFASPFNILLVCIPISWALHFALDGGGATTAGPECTDHLKNNIAVFVTAFVAIVPLAQLLSYGTEEVAIRVGQTLGGLINATLGNAVELIVAIIALFQCQLTIVQTSLIGSVLSNLLLVLGTCFFVGGLRYEEQEFKQTAAQLNSGLLAMAVIAVITPAAFHATLGATIEDNRERPDILKMSRGVAVILLFIYLGYLYFSLRSHKRLYDDDETDEEEVPTLSMPVAVGLLCVSTALVGVTSEWLVDSINGVTCTGVLSKTWVGLILLPIVSNAAEHWSAVNGASKDKMDLAMGVAVGSSIQISIFVIPLLVIISWIADKPLTLLFDPFIAILLFLAILIVNYAIQDGRSNYMEGYLLLSVYVIDALVAWFVGDGGASLFPDSICRI